MDQEVSPAHAIRVLIQQPTLPAYRVPVFASLAAMPSLRLRVVHGALGTPPSVEARGFDCEVRPDRPIRPGLRWSHTQWNNADRSACDVLVLEWNIRIVSLLPAIIRARRRGVGVVLWGHARSAHASRVRRALRNRLARLADAVVVYTPRGRHYLLEQGLDPSRVFVALNTLDQAPIQRAREQWIHDKDALRSFQRAQGIMGRDLILFSSTLLPGKRADLLLEAAVRLRSRGLEPMIAIVGHGPQERALRERARRLGVEGQVRFLGGLYDEHALAPWFLSARVLCHPRSIGLSILHAFGYGLPVITSDDLESHHPEIGAFAHGSTGLFYRDGDADDLAAALQRLLADSLLRERCSIEARRVALEEFPLRTMVGGLASAIHSAFARRNPARDLNATPEPHMDPIPVPTVRAASDAVA